MPASSGKNAAFVSFVAGLQFCTGAIFSLLPGLAVEFVGEENLGWTMPFLITGLAVGAVTIDVVDKVVLGKHLVGWPVMVDVIAGFSFGGGILASQLRAIFLHVRN